MVGRQSLTAAFVVLSSLLIMESAMVAVALASYLSLRQERRGIAMNNANSEPRSETGRQRRPLGSIILMSAAVLMAIVVVSSAIDGDRQSIALLYFAWWAAFPVAALVFAIAVWRRLAKG